MNNCEDAYELTWTSGNSVAWTYRDCDNGSEVSLVTIDEGEHVLYEGEGTDLNISRIAWDFMKKFSK